MNLLIKLNVMCYAHNIGFTIRLKKSEYLKESKNKSNSLEKSFRKRTLLCSQPGFAKSKESGIDVLTICAILKEEFGDYITWMHDDIYNFIYHLEELGSEKREIDAEEFVKILDQFKYDNAESFFIFNDIVVYNNTYKTNHFKIPFGIFTGVNNYRYINQHAPVVILTDNNHDIANAYSKVLQLLEKWAACFNCDTFMADMMTTQHGKPMNNIMKGYLDANTSLTTFITAFQSALNTQSKKTAASILITYAFKKIQEQLMQLFIYKYEDISRIFSQFQDSNTLVQCFVETNFSSNEINLDMQYQYCCETLPNPLPLKVSEYLNDIAIKKKVEGIIIPYRIEKGYLLYIDFAMLPNQIRGALKANSSLLQINYFESFQPENYGSKDLAVILETLTEILIAKDFNNISLDAAKKVMIDSIKFGLYVHNNDNTEK
ncbi:hypothetical protein C2G38_2152825 [Gigaspora rosea]|uniref:Uncharacterized protein n=1 Tax=Gigaspora rosea TaxID=44941 RepID=A0A397W6L1_9GLOM|nr:hypothetical protein C2G38_2152825 [Gigaspora rosea]